MIRGDKFIKLNYLGVVIFHLQFVVQLAKHLLLSVESSHLLRKLRTEDFVYHIAHVVNEFYRTVRRMTYLILKLL